MQPLLIGVGVLALVGVLASSGIFKSGNSVRGKVPTQNFRIADYRRDGSRFASSGNSYVFEGRVENIEVIGDDRLISISIPDNPDERLPLLVPKQTRLKVNLTRGDRFIFETSCRTGMTADGEQVKGILIVKSAETK